MRAMLRAGPFALDSAVKARPSAASVSGFHQRSMLWSGGVHTCLGARPRAARVIAVTMDSAEAMLDFV